MSTFDQLRAEVVFNTFDGVKYLERAGTYLNNAARDVARRSAWGAGEQPATVTAVDQWSGTAPTTMARITAVWEADMTGRKVDRFTFAGDLGSPASAAEPLVQDRMSPSYTTQTGAAGQVLVVVSPVPSALQIIVSGNRLPAAMSDGTDVNELGLEAEDALILFARAKLYLREDDKEMHDALMQSYMDELRRFTIGTRPVAEGPRLTPGTWGDGSFGGY